MGDHVQRDHELISGDQDADHDIDTSSEWSVDASDDSVSVTFAEKTDPSWATPVPVLYSMGEDHNLSRQYETHRQYDALVYGQSSLFDPSADSENGPRFRLLQIDPGTSDQPICGKLISRPVFDAPVYTALSYSWGTGPFSAEILLGKTASPFPVSAHLWSALRRMRDRHQVITLWVDAICINQQDLMERTSQVHIMAQIFNQARAVRVWLGETNDADNNAISDTRLVWSLCRQKNPWWCRLWVLQECAYATSCPVVMFGPHSMTLEDLIGRWRSVSMLYQSLTDQTPYNYLAENLRLLCMLYDTWKVQVKENIHRRPLLLRLRQTAGRICTEDHDKIYAILNLVDEKEADHIPADYRKPYSQLAREVVELLKQSPLWDEAKDRDLLNLQSHYAGTISIKEICYMLPGAIKQESHKGDPKAMQLLLETVLCVVDEDCAGILHDLAKEGLTESVKLLLDKGADSNVIGGEYGSALQAASFKGHFEVVTLLLDRGADANICGGYYTTPLGAASMEGHFAVVEVLLKKGAAVDVGTDHHGSALQIASTLGHWKIVRLLLEHGADVNAHGGIYNSTLHTALASGKSEIVHEILNRGADVDQGKPLCRASSQGDVETVRLLLAWGANVHVDCDKALKDASRAGYTAIVQLLLEKGADADRCGALCAAAWPGHLEVIQLLLRHGADVHIGSDEALRDASTVGHNALVQTLLDSGADVNAQGGKYGSALQAASCCGHTGVVRTLLAHGADVNAQGGHYGSALQAASSRGRTGLVRTLLAHGADVNAQGGKYGSALQAASCCGRTGVVRTLLAHGADVNAQGGHYGSALQAAASRGYVDTVQLLLGHTV